MRPIRVYMVICLGLLSLTAIVLSLMDPLFSRMSPVSEPIASSDSEPESHATTARVVPYTGLVEPDPASYQSHSREQIAHTVKAGETLYGIALRYGVALDSLISENQDLVPEKLSIGQIVTVPPAERHSGQTHRVEAGESLWQISRRYGISLESIAQTNGIANYDAIREGQILVIPGKGLGNGDERPDQPAKPTAAAPQDPERPVSADYPPGIRIEDRVLYVNLDGWPNPSASSIDGLSDLPVASLNSLDVDRVVLLSDGSMVFSFPIESLSYYLNLFGLE